MFFTPYFGGCKYTNYFLFINKNIEFQWLGMLITLPTDRLEGPSYGVSGKKTYEGPEQGLSRLSAATKR